MRDKQVGQALGLLQVEKNVERLGLDRDVQGARGLVEHEELRAQHDGASDGDTLLLAAGQLGGPAVQELGAQADLLARLRDQLVGTVDVVDLERATQDLADGPTRVERRGGVLEHGAHLVAVLATVAAGDVDATHADGA